jgi:hypothetical protein
MATISKKIIEVAKTLHGGPPIIVTYPEAASQDFLAGELVYLVSGKVTQCGANPTIILGIAMHDASETTDTDVQVCLATADTIFSANRDSGVTAVTDVGQSYRIAATSNKWHIVPTTGANARVLVVELDTRDTVGDTSGRLLFIINGSYRQFEVTS